MRNKRLLPKNAGGLTIQPAVLTRHADFHLRNFHNGISNFVLYGYTWTLGARKLKLASHDLTLVSFLLFLAAFQLHSSF